MRLPRRVIPTQVHTRDFGLIAQRRCVSTPVAQTIDDRSGGFRLELVVAAPGWWAPSNCRRWTMDTNRIEGSWSELKGKAKQQWGNLTDNELTQIGGKKDELIGRIQARYGYSKDKAKQEVESWLESMGQSGETVMAQV